MRQRADGIRTDDASMIDNLLKLDRRKAGDTWGRHRERTESIRTTWPLSGAKAQAKALAATVTLAF